MKFNVGDKVSLLNSIGEGVIKSFQSNTIADVLMSDGFIIPVQVEELVKISGNDKYFHEEKKKPTLDEEQTDDAYELSYKTQMLPKVNKKKTIEPKQKIEKEPEKAIEQDYEVQYYKDSDDIEIMLGVLALDIQNKSTCDIEVYLINDSNYDIFYNLLAPAGNLFSSIKQGFLEPNTKYLLDSFKREEVKEALVYNLQIIFYKNTKHVMQKPVHQEIKINAMKFYKEGSFQENDFFEQKAMIIDVIKENLMEDALKNLSESDLVKIKVNKEIISKKINTPVKAKADQSVNQQEMLVDLHIHELIDDESGLSPKDKLDLQLKTFHDKLQESINLKFKRVVFIHGVGNGTLKLEIRRELERKYKHLEFQDASFAEYGWGATMVLIRQNK